MVRNPVRSRRQVLLRWLQTVTLPRVTLESIARQHLLRAMDALVEHKEVVEGVMDGLLHALDKLRRIHHHQVIVNDVQPVAGLSTINQEHTAILAAMTI
jgi:hypothetical protein